MSTLARDFGHVLALGIFTMIAAIVQVVAHDAKASRMFTSVFFISHTNSPVFAKLCCLKPIGCGSSDDRYFSNV